MRRESRERFPCHQLQSKQLVSDPGGMHHGSWVTHVSWCMSGSLTRWPILPTVISPQRRYTVHLSYVSCHLVLYKANVYRYGGGGGVGGGGEFTDFALSKVPVIGIDTEIEVKVASPVTRAGVKYVLSDTNTNTKIWIFQIQIQIFSSTLIQIQIQIHRFKYKYKYVQPNISAETVQDLK